MVDTFNYAETLSLNYMPTEDYVKYMWESLKCNCHKKWRGKLNGRIFEYMFLKLKCKCYQNMVSLQEDSVWKLMVFKGCACLRLAAKEFGIDIGKYSNNKSTNYGKLMDKIPRKRLQEIIENCKCFPYLTKEGKMENVSCSCVQAKIGKYDLYWEECVLEQDNVEIFKMLEEVLTEEEFTKMVEDCNCFDLLLIEQEIDWLKRNGNGV